MCRSSVVDGLAIGTAHLQSIKGGPLELRNEFSHVRVELDTAGNGPRLMIAHSALRADFKTSPLD